MKKKNKNKISNLLSAFLIVVSIILVFSIISLNILTTKYLLIIGVLILIVDIILLILMHTKKKKIIGNILSIILTIILSIVSFYILRTNNVLSGFNKNYKTYNYSVVVLENSQYQELNDIKNKTLGYYKTDEEECKKSLEELKNKVDTSNKKYSDIYTLASSLLDKEIEVMLIEDSYLSILKEEAETHNIDNFEDRTKVIYTYSIKINISDISKDVNVTKEAFNIYISGIDTYGTVSSVSRSDVNIVATINPKTQQILLTSIPRDYYVQLYATTGYRDKLTHAGLYGVDMSIKTIEELLDIKINYYVKVNFTSIIDIVDSLEGVEVYSDYTFTSIDGYNYQKGYNKVDGKEALSFVRERKAFATGDRQRIKNQQALIEALFRKCTSKDIITKYNNLLNSLSNSFVTNMPTDRITSLVKMQISKSYSWTITSNSLTGTDSSNYTNSVPNAKSYVMEPDIESVTEASNMIESVITGEVLEGSYNNGEISSQNVTQNKNNSSTNNKTETKEENTTSEEETNKGLEAKLIKSNISFVTGDDYIYHGFTATYNDKDVTELVKVTFGVSGAVFDNYKDLVQYVSNLSPGEYKIIYNITYLKETTILTQEVLIEELPTEEDNETAKSEENKDIEESNDSEISENLNN